MKPGFSVMNSCTGTDFRPTRLTTAPICVSPRPSLEPVRTPFNSCSDPDTEPIGCTTNRPPARPNGEMGCAYISTATSMSMSPPLITWLVSSRVLPRRNGPYTENALVPSGAAA